ncbi:BTAD domain-containing putative transcriptional regulator [Mycobacterium sp. 236(2023)]|uniref:BTAD domain-containing putative transcriptional regulator n=1 Tax=Mycobacterium sp. 236(2023) TaxID=3038163 RepID=UPI002414F542|nr:BTAD domain-containing putative transcriptional regulator [Mycobacterium sp. 236(2023)]MDG4664354.1 BTAD domain-containing putative transcriptional regulator [Mycobacterium sp. 236(2023)]
MRYRLLGPLQVVDGEVPVDIGPRKQRAVLAALLLAQGRVVSTDRLTDAVWGDDVPASATASLQVYISNLRRALRGVAQMASPIVRQPPGYFLDVTPDDVDVTVFAASCARAATAIDAERWEEALAESDGALSLVRGSLLEDMGDADWIREDAARLAEMHTECLANKVISLLALGKIPAALAEVTRLRALDPLADRGCRLHMLTLYRAGRAAEALDAYTRHARVLDDELGLQPGPELRELQTAVLRQAPELAGWPRSPEWTGAVTLPEPESVPASSVVVESAPHRAPLVGRRRELARAADVLARVTAGAARWLVLSGPPGIGKTRLAEEIAGLVTAGGGDTVWVNCPDERGTPPWWPMRHLVRALGADADSVLEVPPHADPDTARFLVYERVQRLLESSPRLLAVVVDDVQWSDTASASCLAYIAGSLRDHPVLVIVTVRDGEHAPEVARLLSTVARGEDNRHIEVPALSSADVATLANEVAEEAVTAAEAAELADRTGGNPFFVSEYARLPRAERAGNEIPHAVRSVLDRRLAALDPAVVQVLRAAAVIGDEIDAGAVPVLAQATRLDLDTLADYLDEAADERIVVTAHAGGGYEFAHGLLREQLLASMPALRRQRIHAKVAEVLADSTAHDAPTRRAQHLVAAQPLVEPAVVVQACRLAAEQATAQWSSDIAARWWQAALDAYDSQPASLRDDGERDALTVELLEAHSRAGRGQLVLDSVQRYLGEALRTGRIASAGRVASALLRASGGWPWLAPGHDPGELLGLLARAATLSEGEPASAARVLPALAVGHCYNPDATVAPDLLDRADILADATGDPDVIADVLIGRLITFSGVSTLSEQTLSWVDRLDSLQHSRSREDAVIAHSVATMAAMNLSDVAGARRHVQAGIAGSEELQLPVLRAQLRWMEAVLAVWVGDFAEAERHHAIAAHVHEQTELYEAGSGLLATATLLRERGGPVDPRWHELHPSQETGGMGMVGVVRTAVLTLLTGPDARAEALATLRQWSSDIDRAHIWTTLGHHALLAHLAVEHDLPEFAEQLLAELAPYRDRIAVIGQVGLAGPVALATARLHALRGDHGQALDDLTVARGIAERSAGVPTLLRCRLLECELAEPSPERSAAARRLATEAADVGMAAVAAAARALE